MHMLEELHIPGLQRQELDTQVLMTGLHALCYINWRSMTFCVCVAYAFAFTLVFVTGLTVLYACQVSGA